MYWIGGGSGAGKSTIARRIAARRGMRVYATDDVMPDHATRLTPQEAPLLREFIAMDMDQRWLTRSPETMLATFHWYRGEGFRLIIEDLLRMPRRPRVIVEGFRLLPHLVAPVLSAPGQAVWLAPTPQFRHVAFDSRGSTWKIAGRTSDPQRALRNLLDRDRMFTEHLAAQVRRVGLSVIEVDTTVSADDLETRVTDVLGL